MRIETTTATTAEDGESCATEVARLDTGSDW